MRAVLMCMAMLTLVACQRDSAPPRTREQKLLYMLGVAIAREHGVLRLTPEELEHVERGMREQVLREKRAMELEISDQIIQMAERRMTELAAREKEKSKRFLEQEAREQGVLKTESGLLFRPLAEGTGPSPSSADMVKVHCRGLSMDGTEFDNSYKKGQPLQFPVGKTLPCLAEGLQRMKVGGKARLVCAPELAFNDNGLGDVVPPGAAVVFELELLEIVSPG
jgi:FKBP-type peptidyl-prolyl cis-trans isomerase FkpA